MISMLNILLEYLEIPMPLPLSMEHYIQFANTLKQIVLMQ